jgi:type IV pilus assembly protein PilP
MRTGTLFTLLVVAAACSTQTQSSSPVVLDADAPSASSVLGEQLVSEPPKAPPITIDPSLRDPFQPGPVATTIEINPGCEFCLFPTSTLDQLRFIGTVTGGEEPRAMLVDPNGRGETISRGSLIGKTELSDGEYLAWRVDRIQMGKVILVREHATRRDQPPDTRVLALHANET